MKIIIGFVLALFLFSHASAEEKECGAHDLQYLKPSDIISGWTDLSTYENKFIRYDRNCLAICEVRSNRAICSFPKNKHGVFD